MSLAQSVNANATKGYVGAETCGQCHQTQFQLWKDSDHDWAMRPANDTNVLGDFDNTSLEHFGVSTRFLKRDGAFFVNTENAEGKRQDFRISYTFGFYPLQQYLIGFPDGRYQALSIAWDSRPEKEGGQRWFHLYPDEAIPHGDVLHWTGSYFNWNSRCADCHSTALEKNYKATENSYDTQWAEINVACEACHGPGKAHINWSKQPDLSIANKGFDRSLTTTGHWQRDANGATAQLINGGKVSMDGQLAVCGSCHSRRTSIGAPHKAGNFHNAHQLQLLEDPLYFADGQIRDEDYVLGSFVQSKMFHEGVVCSNCHDPHSLKLKAPGNAVCAQCHNPQVFDSKSHHHHPQGTGNQCVNCHMPETTYMVVDPRRDHSIRIPRPDLSETLGTPNACNQCHTDKNSDWATKALENWLSQTGKALPTSHYGQAFAAAFKGSPSASEELRRLADNSTSPAIVRGSALALLNDLPSLEALGTSRKHLHDSDPLVRIGAIKALAMLPPNQRLADLLPLLSDPIKAVRIEAAAQLTAVDKRSLNPSDETRLDAALQEYLATIKSQADFPEGQLRLGNFYLDQGKLQLAEQAYRRSIRLAPALPGAYMNLADLYRQLGQDDKAAVLLEQAISKSPNSAAPIHALGLLRIRERRYIDAEKLLAKAAKLAPENARYAYVYAVALSSIGKQAQAIRQLEQALGIHPQNPELLSALLDLQLKNGDWQGSLNITERLLSLQPSSVELQQLIRTLRSRQEEK